MSQRSTLRKALHRCVMSKDEQLGEAARWGDIQEMQHLMGKGANPNAYLSDWGTPLHCAVEHLQLRAVELLIEQGVELDPIGPQRSSPLRRWYERVQMEKKAQAWIGVEDIPETIYQIGLTLATAGAQVKGMNRGMALTGAKTDTFIQQDPFLSELQNGLLINAQALALGIRTPVASANKGPARRI